MSFTSLARKVRDPALAYGRRINALAGCVERYQPIGFHDTFGYLAQVAGPFRRDEAALHRALDALTASRDLWLVELAAYASRRRQAKRDGHRRPRTGDANPSLPACWYGDRRNAALFVLALATRQHEADMRGRFRRADPEVLRLAAKCLDGAGRLGWAERLELGSLGSRFRQLQRVSGWPDMDWSGWWRAYDSLWVLHQIENAGGPSETG